MKSTSIAGVTYRVICTNVFNLTLLGREKGRLSRQSNFVPESYRPRSLQKEEEWDELLPRIPTFNPRFSVPRETFATPRQVALSVTPGRFWVTTIFCAPTHLRDTSERIDHKNTDAIPITWQFPSPVGWPKQSVASFSSLSSTFTQVFQSLLNYVWIKDREKLQWGGNFWHTPQVDWHVVRPNQMLNFPTILGTGFLRLWTVIKAKLVTRFVSFLGTIICFAALFKRSCTSVWNTKNVATISIIQQKSSQSCCMIVTFSSKPTLRWTLLFLSIWLSHISAAPGANSSSTSLLQST